MNLSTQLESSELVKTFCNDEYDLLQCKQVTVGNVDCFLYLF